MFTEKMKTFLTNVLIFFRLFLLLHFLIFNSCQNKGTPLTLLFSAVDDKDYTDMIHTICSRITFRQVVVTSVGGYRQVPAERCV